MKRRVEGKYKKKGITLHPAWISFPAFFADMGVRPEGRTLERTDNTKGYEPGNCIWATAQEQQNNKSNTVFLTYMGIKKPIADWAREMGIPLPTLHRRHTAYKWDDAKAITTPINTSFRSKNYGL